MNKRKFNPEIDLLKFFFSIIVVVYHSKYLLAAEGYSILVYGFTVVDFFFIISGYLMVVSSKKYDSSFLGKSTADFIINKIKSFFPYMLFAFFAAFAVRQASFFLEKNYDIVDFLKDAVLSVNEVLLLHNTGIDFGTIYNGPTWYLSAMLLSMAVLFPVLLKRRDWFVNIGSLVIAIFCYAFISQEKGTLNSIAWSGFFSFGIIRAVAGLCIGCFIYSLTEKIKSSGIVLKKKSKFILWLTEMATIGLLLVIMQFEGENKFDFVSIIFIFFICLINLSELTGVQNILPQKICSFLGKCSLLLYLNHRYVVYLINTLAPELSFKKSMVIYICGTFIMATVAEIIVTTCRKLWEKISPTIKRTIIE